MQIDCVMASLAQSLAGSMFGLAFFGAGVPARQKDAATATAAPVILLVSVNGASLLSWGARAAR